ncbi:hypothetical protein BC835DRAFT_901417 [Cytidiella melzeri]|nr:hypothetical protein BC835DRAFT_901417 [Cytidiella melzeri]
MQETLYCTAYILTLLRGRPTSHACSLPQEDTRNVTSNLPPAQRVAKSVDIRPSVLWQLPSSLRVHREASSCQTKLNARAVIARRPLQHRVPRLSLHVQHLSSHKDALVNSRHGALIIVFTRARQTLGYQNIPGRKDCRTQKAPPHARGRFRP